jgi:hypothetical protein
MTTKAMYVEITAEIPTAPMQRMMSSITANLDDQMAAGGLLNTPIMSRSKAIPAADSIPSAPVEKKELVPMSLVVNTNSALVVEMEKVNVKLDLLNKNLVEFEAVIMDGVGAVVPSVPVPEVAPLTAPVPAVDLDATNTLMMRQYDEMRRVMVGEQEKTRVFIMTWAIFMVVFIFAMAIVVFNMLKKPAVCEPCRECAVVNDWMMAKCFAHDWSKTARDEWVRIIN